jgi:hypothetical protein
MQVDFSAKSTDKSCHILSFMLFVWPYSLFALYMPDTERQFKVTMWDCFWWYLGLSYLAQISMPAAVQSAGSVHFKMTVKMSHCNEGLCCMCSHQSLCFYITDVLYVIKISRFYLLSISICEYINSNLVLSRKWHSLYPVILFH